jgi:peptidoglycan/LPS O-acetylase OafA/YrhL
MRTVFRALRSYTIEIFHRPSANLAPIDGIRALSMLGVLLYHIFFLIRLFATPEQFQQLVLETPWYLGWVWTLDYTVDAFFVISGYLIAMLLYREHSRTGSIDLKRFYWRRYLRLTPAYFAFIGLYLLLSPRPEPNLWANLLYVQNFITLPEMSMPWTWTLAVEEQFYLLFPLLLLFVVLKSRSPLLILVLLLAAAAVITVLVAMRHDVMWNKSYVESFFINDDFLIYYDSFYVNLHTRFGPFISGAIAAYLMHYHRDWIERLRQQPLLFNGISIAAVTALVWILGFNPYTGEPGMTLSRWHLTNDRNLFGIALSWIIVATLGNPGVLRPVQHFLSLKLWYPFAQLSYSMYLLHYGIVILVLVNVLGNLKHRGLVEPGMTFPYEWLLPAFLVALLVTTLLSIVLCVLVEKPFMHLRDHLSSARPKSAPALEPGA